MSAAGRQDEYAVRQGHSNDLVALLALQEACAGAPHWSNAIWSDLLSANSDRVVLVMQRANEVVGSIVLRVVADIAELESLAVSERHRGRGHGRALCGQGIAWAVEAHAEEMLLEVRASNLPALALYRAMGFIQQGRRPAYYAGPVEDALLLSLSLLRTA